MTTNVNRLNYPIRTNSGRTRCYLQGTYLKQRSSEKLKIERAGKE